MERHLPDDFLRYVQREGKLYHVLVQAVVVRGRQLAAVYEALNAVKAEPGYRVEFADDPRVLPVDQAGQVDEQLPVHLGREIIGLFLKLLRLLIID